MKWTVATYYKWMCRVPFHFVLRGEVSLLKVWKNALELFVWNKSSMNSNHEFALVILKDKANWVSHHVHTYTHILCHMAYCAC